MNNVTQRGGWPERGEVAWAVGPHQLLAILKLDLSQKNQQLSACENQQEVLRTSFWGHLEIYH